jgi:glycosyltransferase 2 family protein
MLRWVKTGGSFFLRFGVSALLLWIVFIRIEDKDRIAQLVRTADLFYILPAFIVFTCIHGLLIVRWRLLIRAFDLDVSWINMSRYFFLGLFGNLFMPTAIGGDVIKTAGLCVNSRQKPKVVASVLLDRLSGFGGMVVVSCAALIVGFPYLKNPAVWLTIGMMTTALAGVAVILLHEKVYRFFCQAFYFFPRLRSAVMQMHYDIALLKGRKRAVFQAVGLSCVAQGLLATVFFMLSRAIHQEIPFFYFIIFTPIACIAASFPSIGGLGFREGVMDYLLVDIGAAAGIGMGISLLSFAFMVIVGACGGIFFAMTKDHACVPPEGPNRER